MNTIAIIILAHHNPQQLTLLINHLKADFDVFVQIDKKSALEISSLPQHSNVHYYKEIAVYWGDFSQIFSMYSILKKAYNHKTYTNYLYISGDDIPIKSNIEIKQFFAKNKSAIYTYANPLPIKTWGFNHGFDRLDRYWFMRFKSRKFVKIFARLTLIIQRVLFIKVKKFPITYYAGSNWINLTKAGAKCILDFIDQNPLYFKKLKYSRATDEIWSQTILMNSPLKKHVINYDLRYIDWTSGPDYPRTLNITDFKKIMASDALFARKFNLKKDDEIIFKILRTISNKKQ